MINLNNAEKQLLERHPSLSESLKIDDFKQLETKIETTQFDTFNTQIEKGKLILQVEENLKNPDVIAMIADMEMTLAPKDIQRIFRISKTWYYRLKKAATFASNDRGQHTRTLFIKAVEQAKLAGEEVKIDIDSYNSVANAKAKAMKAADATRYTSVPAAAREEVLNTLIDTDNDVSPEEIRADIRNNEGLRFTAEIKFKFDGRLVKVKAIKELNQDWIFDGLDVDNVSMILSFKNNFRDAYQVVNHRHNQLTETANDEN